MNWDFVAHIVRDLFPVDGQVLYFGADKQFVDTMRKPEHGVEVFMVHNELDIIDDDHCHYWMVPGINGHYHGPASTDLFLSFGYDPLLDYPRKTAQLIAETMRPGGIVVVTNPGAWGYDLYEFLPESKSLIREMRRYSLFKDEMVLAYENL